MTPRVSSKDLTSFRTVVSRSTSLYVMDFRLKSQEYRILNE